MSDAGNAAPTSHPGLLGHVPAGRLWLAVTLLLVALILALLAWLWWGRVPPVELRVLPAPAAELPAEVRARAEALERAIAELDRRIADDRAATHSLACPPGQRIREGALPVQTAALPVPPSLSAPDGSLSAPLTAIGTGALADRLEQATALVLSENSVGTGFFVAPNLMVTNRHVVEDATDGRVFIASRSLGGARPGVVLRATPPGQPGSADLALIRLTDGVAPAILGLTPVAPKLTPVVAAGYPGLILQNDTGFRRLVAGDARATPDLNLTQGVVQSVQESPQGVPVLVHTASVLQGNSGGPLVDSCGRVVGINTFIAVDAEQSGRVSYAQTTGVIDSFLRQSGARIGLDPRACPQP